MSNLNKKYLSEVLHISMDSFSRECDHILEKENFKYRHLSDSEKEQNILEITKKLFQPDLTRSGQHRKVSWNNGWDENLKLIQNDPHNLDLLKPKYYRPNNINRCGVDYIFSECNQFEYSFFKLIRSYLYHNFINTVSFSKLMEFGCGPAHNIVYFANKDRSKQYVGLDWAHSSQKIIGCIRENHSYNIEGHNFDFFNFDENLNINEETIIVSIGALEQIQKDWENVVNYWIRSKPAMIVQLEPIVELYDDKILIDVLGKYYHQKRNYLDGYLTHLKRLYSKKVISKLEYIKVPICGRFMNGWNIISWKP
jgi:hypothetical protein